MAVRSESPKRILTILLIVAQLVLPGMAGTARAADRSGTTTSKIAPRTVESAREAAIRDAREMSARRVDPATALIAMIDEHGLDLVAAERALAEAHYGNGDRSRAVQDVYNAPTAASEVARAGLSVSDTYQQLRCWQHTAVESAEAILETVPSATPEETAWAMLDDGATPEEIVAFLRYAGWTVDQIALFLELTGLFTGDRILEALLRVIAVAGDAAQDDLSMIFAKLRALFATADAAGDFLMERLGSGWEAVAALMLRAGYTADDVAGWLKKVVGLSALRVGQFLKQVAGLGVDRVFEILVKIGYKLGTVAEVVIDLFSVTAGKLAKLLKKVGASAVKAIAILIDRFGPAIAGQLQSLLVAAKYGTGEVIAALNELFATQMMVMQAGMMGG